MAVALPGAVLPDGQALAEVKLRGETSSRWLPLGKRGSLSAATTRGSSCCRTAPSRARRSRTSSRSASRCWRSRRRRTGRTCSQTTASLGRSRRSSARLRDAGNRPRARRRRARGHSDRGSRALPALRRADARDVRIGPSPTWLKGRLIAAGMRPISNVVDATNYAMLALGSPLHAFDQSRLAEGRIVVRRAQPDEEIRTLDGTVRILTPEDLVIADAERPVAIAEDHGRRGQRGHRGDDHRAPRGGELRGRAGSSARPNGSGCGPRPPAAGRRHRPASRRRRRAPVQPAVRGAGRRRLDRRKRRARRAARAAGRPSPVPSEPPRFSASRSSRTSSAVLEALGFEVGDDWDVTVPTWRARDVTREVDLIGGSAG